MSEKLRAVAQALDDYQRDYELKTYDWMPGNRHYSGKLLAIVQAARDALTAPSCVQEDATPLASQGKLHDAIQQLPVYQMEGTFEGQAFSYVLVRRHEVQQAIYDAFQPASSQSEEPPT